MSTEVSDERLKELHGLCHTGTMWTCYPSEFILVCEELQALRQAREYVVKELLAMKPADSGQAWVVTNVVSVLQNPETFPHAAATTINDANLAAYHGDIDGDSDY